MLRATLFAAIGGLMTALVAFSPGMARADVPGGQIPLSLHTAIQQYIESQGHDYAGLCADVNSNPPLPFGDYCSFVLSIEHDIADVSYGPVASSDISKIYFKNTGGVWTPILPNSPSPTPPPAEDQLPAGLSAAIKQHIESKGHDYAGLCVDVNANPPLPFGEYCAFVLSIEHAIAEISYAPVATDEMSFASFRLEGGQWKLVTQSPTVTPTATPTTPAQPTATPTKASDSVPPALEQAIKTRIEALGKEYAGLCLVVNANPPVPFGKYCAFVNSIRDGVADVSWGPVATNEITRATFKLEGSQWKLVSPATPTKTAVVPLPPSTGSGSGDSNSTGIAIVLAVVAAVIAAGGVGAYTLRSK